MRRGSWRRLHGGYLLGIALVGAAIASAAYGPSPAHRAAAVRQSAGGPSRATPGAVRGKNTRPGTAHLQAGKPISKPHELFLKRAASAVFDVRKLKGAVVKRERPEHEEPYGPPEASAGPVLPSKIAPSGIAAGAAPAPGPDSSFAGLDFATWGAGHPPDENGDVGPTYYIQVVNTSIGIYDKSTGTRVAAFPFDSFMSQGNFGNLCDTNNFGDPVVLYDTFEDRWLITDFAFKLDGSGNVVNPPGAFQCFAVSKTGDPVNGGWNFYSIAAPGALNDYPKFGVWPDGIYMSANMFGYPASGSYEGYHVWALNKQQMYAGAPTVQVIDFAGDTSDFTVIPANARLQAGTPPVGSPEYFVSTEFLNALSIYKFHVDWAAPSASTFTGPQKQLAPNCWPNQSPASASTPANAADVVPIRAMALAQYTNIGGAESLWVDHTVERGVSATNTTCNASKGGNATIRWYQANVTGGTVAANVVQGSTFDPDGANTFFRFMPSLAVDHLGDLAIGYTKSNSTTDPEIMYAGRLAGDPTNTLGLSEQTLIAGTGAQSGSCGGSACTRWGDYSGMALDPNGCEFWLTGEYYATNGLNDLTRIGSFHYPGCTPLGNGTLSGTVTDGTNPIAGATVSLGSRTTTTDGSGNYSFTVPAGTYPSMTAAKQGFNPASASTIVVPNGGTATQNFTLILPKSDQAITVTTPAPPSSVFGTAFAVAATGGGSGNAVTFSSAGGCTNSGATFTMTSGTTACQVKYDQAGNANFNAAPEVTESVTATKAGQSITVTKHAPSSAALGSHFTVAASGGGSGNAVTFSSGGGCSNSGASFTMTSGTSACQVKYDQAGSANYNAAAEVTETVNAPPAPPCLVPKLKGKTLKAAKRALRAHSCSLGKVRRSFSSRVKKGRVISQRPKAGRRLSHGSPVRLVISKGRRS